MWWELAPVIGWVVGVIGGWAVANLERLYAQPLNLAHPCPVCLSAEDVAGEFVQCCQCGQYVCGGCSETLRELDTEECPMCRDSRWGDVCLQDVIELLLRRGSDKRVAYGAGRTAAVLMRMEGNREGERKFLRLSAVEGNPKAAEELGSMVFRGIGGPCDKAEGRRWLQRAATPRALQILSEMASYQKVDMQHLLALTAHPKASQIDQAAAYHQIGTMMDRIEPKKGLRYHSYAAIMGNTDAMTKIGEAMCTGTGVRRDPAIGALWYRLAAKRGNTEAMCVVRLMDFTRGDDGIDEVD